ncbi:MAG: AI-2E family transporter, partial [Terracoccus sp.]
MNSETEGMPTELVPTLPPDEPRLRRDDEPRVAPAATRSIVRRTDGSSAVPPSVRAASEWSGRLLLIGGALFVLALVVREVSEIVVPIAIALLLTALLGPLTARLRRRMPAGAAAGLTLVGLLLVVSGALTLVGSQFSSGFSDLTNQVASGLEQIRDWVRTTFKITDSQFNGYFDDIKNQ